MQLSYPVSQYKNCLMNSFCGLLLGVQYATDIPNTDRLVKFLSRLKEAQFDANDPIPGLTTTDLCKKGLPPNWCYIQYNRSALTIVDDDEFRQERIRTLTLAKDRFSEDRWGFGQTEINCWLVANNGSAIEAAEALYYMNLYKVKSVEYLYLGIPWKSRIIQDSLDSFGTLGIAEYGTGFTITWKAQLFVPILRQEIEGFTVQTVCNEIFTSECLTLPDGSIDIVKIPPFPAPMEYDIEKDVPLGVGLRSQYDPVKDEVITTEFEGRCDDAI